MTNSASRPPSRIRSNSKDGQRVQSSSPNRGQSGSNTQSSVHPPQESTHGLSESGQSEQLVSLSPGNASSLGSSFNIPPTMSTLQMYAGLIPSVSNSISDGLSTTQQSRTRTELASRASAKSQSESEETDVLSQQQKDTQAIMKQQIPLMYQEIKRKREIHGFTVAEKWRTAIMAVMRYVIPT